MRGGLLSFDGFGDWAGALALAALVVEVKRFTQKCAPLDRMNGWGRLQSAGWSERRSLRINCLLVVKIHLTLKVVFYRLVERVTAPFFIWDWVFFFRRFWDFDQIEWRACDELRLWKTGRIMP